MMVIQMKKVFRSTPFVAMLSNYASNAGDFPFFESALARLSDLALQ